MALWSHVLTFPMQLFPGKDPVKLDWIATFIEGVTSGNISNLSTTDASSLYFSACRKSSFDGCSETQKQKVQLLLHRMNVLSD